MNVPIDSQHQLALTVAAIVERLMPGRSAEPILVGWKDATGALGVVGADAFAVRLTPGTADTSAPLLAAIYPARSASRISLVRSPHID
jgi:hypothetical protein